MCWSCPSLQTAKWHSKFKPKRRSNSSQIDNLFKVPKSQQKAWATGVKEAKSKSRKSWKLKKSRQRQKSMMISLKSKLHKMIKLTFFFTSNTSCWDTKWESFDFFYRDAVAEILRDTVRSATRAEISGSWRAPKTKVQSRLLDNALSQALQSNRRLSKKSSKWILSHGWKTCH